MNKFRTKENPEKEGVVELLNSSIHDMAEFTICGRVSAQSFSTEHHVWQNLLFKVTFFGSKN